MFGELEYYDEEYDRVSVKKPRALKRLEKRMFYYVPTCEDEVGGSNVYYRFFFQVLISTWVLLSV